MEEKGTFAKTARETHISDGFLVLVTKEYYDLAMSLFKQFARDEPITSSLQMPWNEEYEEVFRNALRSNLSLMIIDSETKEPMAIRIIQTTSASKRPDRNLFKTEAVKKLIAFVETCDNKSLFYDVLGSDEAIHFFGLCVADKYRNRGFGTKVFEAAIKMVEYLDIGKVYIKGEGTSNYSKRIYEKFGFQTLYEQKFDEYIVDGSQVFCNTGEHKSMKTYSKLVDSRSCNE